MSKTEKINFGRPIPPLKLELKDQSLSSIHRDSMDKSLKLHSPSKLNKYRKAPYIHNQKSSIAYTSLDRGLKNISNHLLKEYLPEHQYNKIQKLNMNYITPTHTSSLKMLHSNSQIPLVKGVTQRIQGTDYLKLPRDKVVPMTTVRQPRIQRKHKYFGEIGKNIFNEGFDKEVGQGKKRYDIIKLNEELAQTLPSTKNPISFSSSFEKSQEFNTILQSHKYLKTSSSTYFKDLLDLNASASRSISPEKEEDTISKVWNTSIQPQCKNCMLHEKVIKELERMLLEKEEDNMRLLEMVEKMKQLYGIDFGSQLQKYKMKYLRSEMEGDLKEQQIKQYQNIFNYLKFYKGFSKQQSKFIEFIKEMQKMERMNDELKEKCGYYQKELKNIYTNKIPPKNEGLERSIESSKKSLSRNPAYSKEFIGFVTKLKKDEPGTIPVPVLDKPAPLKKEVFQDPLDQLNQIVSEINRIFARLDKLFCSEEFLRAISFTLMKKTELSKFGAVSSTPFEDEKINSEIKKQLSSAPQGHSQSQMMEETENYQDYEIKSGKNLIMSSISDSSRLISDSRSLIAEGLSVILDALGFIGNFALEKKQNEVITDQ